MLDRKAQSTMMLKLKFVIRLLLDVTKSSLEIVIFDPKEMPGILDIKIGYYKIKQGILQQNVSKYYRFKSADTLCEQFYKFINILKKEGKGRNAGKISIVRTRQ